MSLSSAMLVGFTGITSNSVAVDTVGDNLANVNTTAFKGQRTLFETLLYNTIREGEGPSPTSGGTLPFQMGTGSQVAVVQRSFSQGSIEGTAFPSDLAIDGDGFFVLDHGDGTQAFTRDGSFRLNAEQALVASDGSVVQVFPADADGNVQAGTLSPLTIPLGSTGEALPTTEVILDGQLDSGTTIAAEPSVVASQALMTAGGTAATAATSLSAILNGEGVPLFSEGDILSIRGTKGGLSVPESTFVVGSTGNTLEDLAQFMETVLGIDPTTEDAAGVTVGDGTTGPGGALVVTSNLGEAHAVALDAGSITNTTGALSSPFTFSQSAPAVGGGLVTTSFQVFDSLGAPVDVRLRLSLESKSSTGTTWRFQAESAGDSDASFLVGSGTMTFDAQGRFVAATGTDLSIDRDATGASTPQAFTLDLSQVTGFASADGSSELRMESQDGAPAGTLVSYSIDDEGVVRTAYSNQTTRVIGQVALAVFRNNEGLIAQSDNTYFPGVNSGDPRILAPRTETAGAIRSGSLEQSNVEIAREFVNLITASTGISSASRVVRVADDLLQELLQIAQ
ncbi:MAG: flagellar hook-basal body complex protein [Planctomycetota bacterium]